MKQLVCTAIAILLAPAALADEFCDDLRKTIAAAAEAPAPFDTLVDPAKKLRDNGQLSSMTQSTPLRGLPEGARCERYLAYVDGKVVGGGTHNYISCLISSGSDEDTAAIAKARAAHTDILARTKACLAPTGWKMGKKINNAWRGGREESHTFNLEGSSIDVMSLASGSGRWPPYRWRFELRVRTPAAKAPS